MLLNIPTSVFRLCPAHILIKILLSLCFLNLFANLVSLNGIVVFIWISLIIDNLRIGLSDLPHPNRRSYSGKSFAVVLKA